MINCFIRSKELLKELDYDSFSQFKGLHPLSMLCPTLTEEVNNPYEGNTRRRV